MARPIGWRDRISKPIAYHPDTGRLVPVAATFFPAYQRPSRPPGYFFYFLHLPDPNWFKIGISQNPWQRVQQIKDWPPRKPGVRETRRPILAATQPFYGEDAEAQARDVEAYMLDLYRRFPLLDWRREYFQAPLGLAVHLFEVSAFVLRRSRLALTFHVGDLDGRTLVAYDLAAELAREKAAAASCEALIASMLGEKGAVT